MLKGKRVLVDNYFGTVLNNAEVERVLILELKRGRRHRSGDRWTPPASWWEEANGQVAVYWPNVGDVEICPVMPKWLHLRNL